jgi:uncharacterized damage-inducible protein DinB
MKSINWFDRKFDFGSDENIFPLIIERLAGTPVRIAEKLKGMDPAIYTVKVDNKWSILEHLGHLSDLEPLWQGRLVDILEGRTELRPTDLNNTKTDQANHNASRAEKLFNEFKTLRITTLRQLEGLTEAQIFLSALHPRLKTPMRMMDLFLFVAEHDDHHLAKMTEIHRTLRNG